MADKNMFLQRYAHYRYHTVDSQKMCLFLFCYLCEVLKSVSNRIYVTIMVHFFKSCTHVFSSDYFETDKVLLQFRVTSMDHSVEIQTKTELV
jgi:hypothetical protein